MKKILCILAGAALFGACEQRTEVIAPAGSTPVPEKKTEHNTTIVNPAVNTEKTKETKETNTIVAPADTEKKTETTTTTTTSSPNP